MTFRFLFVRLFFCVVFVFSFVYFYDVSENLELRNEHKIDNKNK